MTGPLVCKTFGHCICVYCICKYFDNDVVVIDSLRKKENTNKQMNTNLHCICRLFTQKKTSSCQRKNSAQQ